MKLTLTKEKSDEGPDMYVIRKNGVFVTWKIDEQEAVETFDKCVEANSLKNKPILLREVEI